MDFQKLDGVGAVDNRPSTQKFKKTIFLHEQGLSKIILPKNVCRLKIILKFKFPSSNGLGFLMSWRLGGKGSLNESFNELMTKVFVEQRRLHWVC